MAPTINTNEKEYRTLLLALQQNIDATLELWGVSDIDQLPEGFTRDSMREARALLERLRKEGFGLAVGQQVKVTLETSHLQGCIGTVTEQLAPALWMVDVETAGVERIMLLTGEMEAI